MTTHSLPQPIPNGDSLPYWSAARENRLVIRHCKTCGAKHFMPRYLCPKCWSDDLEWVESKGWGSVASFSIVHRAPTPIFAAIAPYVVALIDLDEGPRMFANVVGEDARAVSIGDRVRVIFEDRGAGAVVPQFVRVAGQA
jgi:uncharacterized protein